MLRSLQCARMQLPEFCHAFGNDVDGKGYIIQIVQARFFQPLLVSDPLMMQRIRAEAESSRDSGSGDEYNAE